MNGKLWDTRYGFIILGGYQKSCYGACSLNSREQGRWEANSCLANQEISPILRNPEVCYRIHKSSPPPVPILSLSPRLEKCFVTWLRFYGEVLLPPRPAPKLEDHPLSAVRDCLFTIFAAALHMEYAMALLVEALRFKLGGLGFYSLCDNCDCFFT